MFARSAFSAILLFIFTFHIYGASARPSFSLASKRSPSASSLAASLQYNTNAKRMAAGFHPLSPTRIFDASRVVPRAVQSPVSYSGSVRVKRASDSSNLGYVSQNLHSSGRFTVTTSTSAMSPASLSYVDSNTLLQLNIGTNSAYLGAAGSTIQTNNNNRLSIVVTNSVPSGSIPTNVGNSAGSGGSESYIWKYNPTTQELTATWVNPNGNSLSAHIYYEDTGPNTGLHLSGNSNLPGGFTRVRLFLV